MPLPAAPAPDTKRTMSARARKDVGLVAAALAGKANAYEELLRHYRTAVYHLVLRIVPQADDAEDVTMETFDKAFRHLGRFSPQFAFSTWLVLVNGSWSVHFSSQWDSLSSKTRSVNEFIKPPIRDEFREP